MIMTKQPRANSPKAAQMDEKEKAVALIEALIQKAANSEQADFYKLGEHTELCELCEQIGKGVFNLAKCLVGNTMDAEDISQAVLIRVCENIQSIRKPQSFNAWLYKIIINEANRYMKNNSKYGTMLCIDDCLDEEVEDKNEALPHEHVESEESRQIVTSALDSLSVRQKEAVTLHYYNGLSLTEVAGAMKITKQSVSEYLSASHEKLRRALDSVGYQRTETFYDQMSLIPS